MNGSDTIDRRRMLRVIGVGSSTVALVACGGRVGTNDDGTPSDPDPADPPPGGDPGTDSGGDPGSDTGGDPGTDTGSSPGTCKGIDTGLTTASIAVGTGKIQGSGRSSYIVSQDGSGFFAMTGACSHSGCKLQNKTTEWYCNCHNGHFGLNGEAVRVPRSKPLVHYALSICGGKIFVDSGSIVSADTRVKG